MDKAIITVVGKDTVGIIAKVCGYLADNKINILDECSLTVLNDDMGKAIGEVSGLTTAIMLIRKRGYEHWELSRLEGKENVETT